MVIVAEKPYGINKKCFQKEEARDKRNFDERLRKLRYEIK